MESWREKYCRVDEGLRRSSCALAVLVMQLVVYTNEKIS
jgi:hypothetical protein